MRYNNAFKILFFVMLIFCLASCDNSSNKNIDNMNNTNEIDNINNNANNNKGRLYEKYDNNNYDLTLILDNVKDKTNLGSECVIKNSINSYYSFENIQIEDYQFRYKKEGEKHIEIAIFKIFDTDQNELAFNVVANRQKKILEEDGSFDDKNFVAEQKKGILVVAYMDNANKVVNSILKNIK